MNKRDASGPRTTSNSRTCRLYASWLNRIEARLTALRYFALDGTDHSSHKEQGRAIRRYISWRNRDPHDRRLRKVIDRANVA